MLFVGSIVENIVLFDSGVNINVIIEVVSMVEIYYEVMVMFMVYEFRVGDMGLVLFGGQIQRFIFVWVLYCKLKLLVFDEVMSYLDVVNEWLINDMVCSLNVIRVILVYRKEIIELVDRVFDLVEVCFVECEEFVGLCCEIVQVWGKGVIIFSVKV